MKMSREGKWSSQGGERWGRIRGGGGEKCDGKKPEGNITNGGEKGKRRGESVIWGRMR